MKDYTDAAYDAALEIIHGAESPFDRSKPLPITSRQLAKMIDKATLLPEKHAALLLAQALIDAADRPIFLEISDIRQAIEELRAALSRIKSG